MAGQLRPQLESSARHEPPSRTSSFTGVTYDTTTGRWASNIWISGKEIYLGTCSTAEIAARVYDRAVIHFRKVGARLNFQQENYRREVRQLEEISDDAFIATLCGRIARKTKRPSRPKLQHRQPPIRAPTPSTEREKLDQVEPVPDQTQLDPELLPNCVKDDCASRNFVGQLVHSDQPHSDRSHQVESTLSVPRATHGPC